MTKQTRLEQVATGLEILAGAIVIGASIYSLFEEMGKAKHTPRSIPKQPEVTPVVEALQVGEELLYRTSIKEDQSLREFLQQKYHGLWLIGRTGNSIKDSRKDALAAELRHLHTQLFQATGHDTDRALADWYETVGVGKRIQLVDLYLKSPVVDNAFNAARYAASAFTGTRDPSLAYELSANEWHQIKRHLGVE